MPTETLRGHLRPVAALSLAMLLPSLGTSIANVALPALAASFKASTQDVQWVVVAYLLATTTLIVPAGRLGDIFGRRRMLLAGIGLFTAASVGGLLATNLWLLVVARSMQGAGAAVMMALTVASVSSMVPTERTGSAMGLLATVSAVGTALGPSLGGILISTWGWPAVFAFMAMSGALALLFGHRLFPADSPAGRDPSSLDIGGTVLLATALGTYALATTLDAGSPATTALAGLAAVGFVAFAVVESRTASPLVQLHLLRDRVLTAGLLSLAAVSAIVMATLVVGPFYLSGVLGLVPVETGLVMSVGPGVAAVAGIPAGRLVDRLGPSRATVAGLGSIVVGSLSMAMLPGILGVRGYVASLVFITAGYGLFQAASNTSVMSGAAKDRRGVTAALLGLARNLGLVTGASAMGSLFAHASLGMATLGLEAGGETGMQVTFAVAAALASMALGASLLAMRRHNRVR